MIHQGYYEMGDNYILLSGNSTIYSVYLIQITNNNKGTTMKKLNERILEVLVSEKQNDSSRLGLLKDSLAYLKTVATSTIGLQALNNELDDVVAKEMFDKQYQNKVKGVFRLAGVIKDTKLFIIPDNIRMYNIEDAVKLMEHLKTSEEFTDSDITKCKNKLNKVVFDNNHRSNQEAKVMYNDHYKSVLSELFKEYKLEDDEEKMGLKLDQILAKMSKEKQTEWLNAKLAKLGGK